MRIVERAFRTMSLACAVAAALFWAHPVRAQTPAASDVFEAKLNEAELKTSEVSTAELRRILEEDDAIVLDARPFREFAVSHIPGARNVAAKAGVPMSQYVSDVAEVGRLVGGDKKVALVLYCNGPFCGKSKRLADELRAAGHADVRRYQLGIPVWRALGGVCVIEPEGVRYVASRDQSAVWIDAREAEDFRAGTLPGAQSLPRSLVLEGKDVGEVKRAKDDGRLPMEDHNTRLIVFARDSASARYVAQALAREAFHNVSYFAGDFAQVKAARADAR